MNIIFYFSDQQRFDTLTPEVMPNLCSLIEEDGASFQNTYSPQPVCGPCRAILQSGVYQNENGCYINGISLKTKATLAKYFKEGGYETAYVGKWHLASDMLRFNVEKKPIPKERLGGYEYFRGADVLEFTSHGEDGFIFTEEGQRLDFKGVRCDAIEGYAEEFIHNRDKNKPFFLFISQLEPHHQNDRKTYECPEEDRIKFEAAKLPEDLAIGKGDAPKEFPSYLGLIHRLDKNLERLVSTLKAEGIYEDTIIIYTSDHGCHFKTRNSEYKRSCHDSSIHVPLVILNSSFKGSCTQMVSLIDLPPTLLHLAGLEIPKHFKGYSLLKGPDRDAVYVQISESILGRALRTEKYTYAIKSKKNGYLCKDSSLYYEDFLYDNKKDPHQQQNLIKDPNYAAIKEDLKKLLLREMEKAGEQIPEIRR